jgi:hypothetical protein
MYAFGILSLLLYSGLCFNLYSTQPNPNNLVILNKKNLVFESNNKLLDEIITGKQIISISPGGLKGFYLMGVLNFIKENYNLENYLFTGASAGSWVSLFMSLKTSNNDFIEKIIHCDKIKSGKLKQIQSNIKNEILSNFETKDFNLDRLFIGVTTFNLFGRKTRIYSNFLDLTDAINCCVASSHIPLVTNGLINLYNGQLCLDGGLSSYPYVYNKKPSYHIHLNLFNKNHSDYKKIIPLEKKQNIFKIIKCMFELSLAPNKNNEELFNDGYNDALNNKDFFDKYFLLN